MQQVAMQQDGYQMSTQEVDMQQACNLEDEANKRPRIKAAPAEQAPTNNGVEQQAGLRPHGLRNFEELVAKLLDGSSNYRPIREGDCVRIELDGVPTTTIGRYAGNIDMEAAVEVVDGASYTTSKVPWGSWVSSSFDMSLIDRSKVEVSGQNGVVLVEPADPSDFVGRPTERHTVTVPCSALRLAGGPPTREAAVDMLRAELHCEYLAVMSSSASIPIEDAAAMADFQQRQKNLEEEMELLDGLTA